MQRLPPVQALTGGQWYKAWGETRLQTGTIPTKYQYTGQYNQVIIGLYYYGARWYDAALGRFTQPDTIIPNMKNTQGWDRYAYTLNNPLRYIDPTGHQETCSIIENNCESGEYSPTPTPPLHSTLPTPDLRIIFEEEENYYWKSDPSPTPSPATITASKSPSTISDWLRNIRKVTGQTDPAIPDQFIGTELGYVKIVREFAENILTIDPTNTLAKTIFILGLCKYFSVKVVWLSFRVIYVP